MNNATIYKFNKLIPTIFPLTQCYINYVIINYYYYQRIENINITIKANTNKIFLNVKIKIQKNIFILYVSFIYTH